MSESYQAVNGGSSVPDTGRRHVLVVDDEPKILDIIATGLETNGFKVTVASSGMTAIGLVTTAKPDIVVLDVRMPGMSGIEVCDRIRHISEVPIIMLTGVAGEDAEVAGFEVGADDYVTKPFYLAELVARIEAILHRLERRSSQTS